MAVAELNLKVELKDEIHVKSSIAVYGPHEDETAKFYFLELNVAIEVT